MKLKTHGRSRFGSIQIKMKIMKWTDENIQKMYLLHCISAAFGHGPVVLNNFCCTQREFQRYDILNDRDEQIVSHRMKGQTTGARTPTHVSELQPVPHSSAGLLKPFYLVRQVWPVLLQIFYVFMHMT